MDFIDACLVDDGGCDCNADCSHETLTNEVKCTCNTGYVFDSAGSNAVCVDACEVNNGGCESNAICSHDPMTYAPKCTCKIGYTNVGSDSNVICKGK